MLNTLLSAVSAGALLLTGPLLTLLATNAVVGTDSLIALGLTPVVIAVGLGAQRSGGISPAWLAAGLAAVAGLLLLLPEPALGRWSTDALLVAMPLLTGAGCVLLPRSDEASAWWTASAALLGGFCVFAVSVSWMLARTTERHVAIEAIVFDSVVGLLSVLAALRLRPLQYSAQYPLLALLALTEGWILLRQPLNVRMLAGVLLLAGGTALLVRQRDSSQTDNALSLVP